MIIKTWYKLIVDIATGQIEDREPTAEEQGKNPAAVALGKLGGLKGGKGARRACPQISEVRPPARPSRLALRRGLPHIKGRASSCCVIRSN
jgi:hypothetical protein